MFGKRKGLTVLKRSISSWTSATAIPQEDFKNSLAVVTTIASHPGLYVCIWYQVDDRGVRTCSTLPPTTPFSTVREAAPRPQGKRREGIWHTR